jgi:hypothetical protein
MKRFTLPLAMACLLAAAPYAAAQLITSDVALFYRVYDNAHGKPSAAALQRDYLDAGTPGLRDFIPYRIKSAQFLEQQIASRAANYEQARSCTSAFPALEQRVPLLIDRIAALYPAGTRPRVTVVIGADNSGGTSSTEGVILGLEVTCENRSHSQVPLDDRITYLLAHEMIHTQQRRYAGDTLLAAALNEGVADFVAELISGHTSTEHLATWTKGHEAEIEARFRLDMNQSDHTAWLYNGMGTPEQPGDLGYWVGYRIARSYYEHAADKRAAVARLLEETDAAALLRDSRW